MQVAREHRVLDLVLYPVCEPSDLGVRAGVALAKILVTDLAELGGEGGGFRGGGGGEGGGLEDSQVVVADLAELVWRGWGLRGVM